MACARRLAGSLVVLGGIAGAAPAATAPETPACRGPEYRLLDFWLGEWDVLSEGRLVGRNRISAILGGCAIREEWSGGGSRGESLLYFHSPDRRWKQVWVTDRADRPGALKEKIHREGGEAGAMRFEGEWLHESGKPVRDRTTLRPESDGSVSQRIEVSPDGGRTWRVVFDAMYVRTGPAPDDGARSMP